MINLKDTTFIIPVGIESQDRWVNTKITLSYLCAHLDTNIIVYEYDKEQKVPAILESFDHNKTSITYMYSDAGDDGIFHRTKFLNVMLAAVKTPIVVNYDVDVLLHPSVYLKCAERIRNGVDLMYPYFWGQSQYQVHYSGRNKIQHTMKLDLAHDDLNLTRSEYGHLQFFNTNSYRDGGMENEGFVSYAPEDQERGYRFKALGYQVEWGDDYVYHMEHTRGFNSSSSNPKMQDNFSLFDTIKSYNLPQLVEYYKNIDYLKKYV